MIYTLKSVLSLFLIFSCTNLIAQLPTLQSSGWDRIMMVTDINGRPFRPNYVDVVGHPFLLKDFKWGNIEFLNGRKLENIPCRIDISGDVTREFAIYIEYYVLKNNEFIRLKKEKKFIMDLLSDKSDLMKNVFNSYKTVIRNDIDIIKILDIYNKL